MISWQRRGSPNSIPSTLQDYSVRICPCLAGILNDVKQGYLELWVWFALFDQELIGLIPQSLVHAQRVD